MIVYVNGCSFTAGHTTLRERNGKPWPELFDKDVTVINDSVNGGSSFRALRMCIENVLENNDIDVVICQLSGPERGEMLLRAEMFDHYNKDMYISYGSHGLCLDHRFTQLDILRQEGFKRQPDGETFKNEFDKTLEEKFHYKTRIFNDQMLTSDQDRHLHIIGLCNNLKILCEKKGIKLLFGAMSERCIPNPNILCPKVLTPFSHLCKTTGDLVESDLDFHPNEAGHRKIYRYIISELEKL